uniref:Uncharacterized protein n=1 Tax=Chlamydomonas euryale TaxID=1486919 RepID=A0A7R9V7K6_9CHLO|mmetsp:Transcript_21200/g.63512  ORF Transcript_21200/g.63512 Transcript_21200/m.63512 type:complete len:168 (+) Transcript_21200:2-505(+)
MFTELITDAGRNDGCKAYAVHGDNCSRMGAAWGGGGAGSVFTRAAMHAVLGNISSRACPWVGHDDVSISLCANNAARVAQVLCPEFDMHSSYRSEFHPYQHKLSVHKVYARCDAAELPYHVERMMRMSCNVAHRYHVGLEQIPGCAAHAGDPFSHGGSLRWGGNAMP